MTKCDICNEKCKGDLIILDKNISKELNVCKKCFTLYTNMEFDELRKRVKE